MRQMLNILKVEAKETNGKKFHRVQTDQGWMSCWKDDVADALVKYINVMAVLCDVEEKGDFKNLKSIITPYQGQGGSETPMPDPQYPGQPQFPVVNPGHNISDIEIIKAPMTVQSSIVRQCSVKCATRLVCGMLATNKIDPKLNMPLATMITKTAEEFEEWINRN